MIIGGLVAEPQMLNIKLLTNYTKEVIPEFQFWQKDQDGLGKASQHVGLSEAGRNVLKACSISPWREFRNYAQLLKNERILNRTL